MAEVKIRLHSEVEIEGAPLRDALQNIAQAHEQYCSHILGDPDEMKTNYHRILSEAILLVTIISKMPRSWEDYFIMRHTI